MNYKVGDVIWCIEGTLESNNYGNHDVESPTEVVLIERTDQYFYARNAKATKSDTNCEYCVPHNRLYATKKDAIKACIIRVVEQQQMMNELYMERIGNLLKELQ